VLEVAPTRSAPRPPENRTASRTARGITNVRPVRRLPFMHSSRCRVLYAAEPGEGNLPYLGSAAGRAGLLHLGLEKPLESRHLLRRRPISRPDHTLDDPPLPVDDERLRVTPHLVAVTDLMLGVHQHREGQPQVANAGLDGLLAHLVLAAREQDEATIAQQLVELSDRRHLIATRRAPCGPEIQQDPLAPQAREPHRLPGQVGDGEIWCERRRASLERRQANHRRQPDRRGGERDAQAAAARHRCWATRRAAPTVTRTMLVSWAALRFPPTTRFP